MLYPEQKERENRFKLALRMGIPIFALAVITVTSVLSRYFDHIPVSFVIIAFSMLGIMVYYLFYLIYQGFNERITDPISHAFTREYFMQMMQKALEKKAYTFVLFGIENLDDINRQYGFVNGDRVLRDVAYRLSEYFEEKGLSNIPIAHFKGGDFLIALEGEMESYRSMMDLMCVKFKQYSVNDIEIDLFGSIADSRQSRDLEKIVEQLFELQNEKRKMFVRHEETEVNPDTIERLVIEAIEHNTFSYRYQTAYHGKEPVLHEMTVKLPTHEGKRIHQKRFIPVINRLGLRREYDRLQFDVAIKTLEKIPATEKIAIDISASTLRHVHFFEHVMMRISNNAKTKERLIFVFSEASYYHNVEQFDARLQAYRRAGICLTLDRLGGLHSSLRYLQDLEIDMLRYESHFGKSILADRSSAMLKGFETTAKSIGIRSWIRMIETAAQYDAASALGIDIVQGKYLSPIEEIT